MENGSTLGTWVAYVVIVAFLVFLLVVFVRTMMLFSTLTFMPIARVWRRIVRTLGRREP